MTKKSTMVTYTQLRSWYKVRAAAQLQALIIESQKMSPEKAAKYRAMWRDMLAEFKEKQKYE